MSAHTIYPRSTWRPKYRDGFGTRPIGQLETWEHHSVTTQLAATASLEAEIAEIQKLEQTGQVRFAGGISYTFVLPPSGRIFTGHSIDRIGAHTGGRNTGSAGICLLGNYETNRPTPQQEAALAWLLQHGVANGWWRKPAFNGGHRDVKATACPGRYAYERIPAVNALAAGTPAPAPSTPAPRRPVLAYGSRGTAVGELQTFLKALGLYTGAIDRSYGPATQRAVRAYQQLVGLEVDGVTGPRTWAKVDAGVKPAASTPAVLKVGSTGAGVEQLQRELNRVFPTYSRLTVDRSYGPLTRDVVREFQRRAKSEGRYRGDVDGIVGPLTRAALASYGVRL